MAKEPVLLLRHLVLFKFKAETTPEQVRTIESGFYTLPSKIEEIYDFEWGIDSGFGDKTHGFTHCFVVSFKSEADLKTYGPHPAHEEFKSILFPHLENHLVIDFWAKG